MILADIERKVGVLALAFFVGLGAGWHWRGAENTASIIKQQSQALKGASTGIVQSAAQSQKVEAAIQQSDDSIDQLNKAAQTRLQKGKTNGPSIRTGSDHGDERGAERVAPATEGASLVQHAVGADGRGDDHLDFGTVRLLNRARD